MKIYCNNCGHEITISNEKELHLYHECTICNAKHSFRFLDEQREEEMLEYIKEGFHIFGIEGTLEELENTTPDELKPEYDRVLFKHFKLHLSNEPLKNV